MGKNRNKKDAIKLRLDEENGMKFARESLLARQRRQLSPLARKNPELYAVLNKSAYYLAPYKGVSNHLRPRSRGVFEEKGMRIEYQEGGVYTTSWGEVIQFGELGKLYQCITRGVSLSEGNRDCLPSLGYRWFPLMGFWYSERGVSDE